MIYFIRYLVIGSLSVIIQFLLLALFVEMAQFNPTFSSGLAFLIATLFNYLFQYYWNFKTTDLHRIVLLRYGCVIFLTTLLTISLFWLLNHQMEIWYLYCQSAVTVSVVSLNFLFHRYYTFANKAVEES